MNILVDKLPTTYKGLRINTNFKSFILFELLMQDGEVSQREKVGLALNLFFEEEITDIKLATEAILWFYKCGEENKKSKKKTENGNAKQIYSYEYDAKYIYSAFLDQYGIDLNDAKDLHWFKFKSLFEGLKSDNKICEIMGYRAIDISKIKDKEEQKKYKRLQNQYRLPDNRSVEEKEKEFADAFW